MNYIGGKGAHLWNFETVERFVPNEGAVRSGHCWRSLVCKVGFASLVSHLLTFRSP
jgi:hypothetical protein